MRKSKFLKILGRLSLVASTGGRRYQPLAEAVIKRVCKRDSLCIDVGSNKGDILHSIISHSPGALHYSFEADNKKYFLLVRKFGSAAHIYNFIPSNDSLINNKETFHYNLDNIISPEENVDLVIIGDDAVVYNVLSGATNTIRDNKPAILFSIKQGRNITTTQNLLRLIDEFDMQLNFVKGFLKNQEPLSKLEIDGIMKNNKHHFLIAYY